MASSGADTDEHGVEPARPARLLGGTARGARPSSLHFGDYGGWPMNVLRAALDIATNVVLGSGVDLWLKRRPARPGLDLTGSAVAG